MMKYLLFILLLLPFQPVWSADTTLVKECSWSESVSDFNWSPWVGNFISYDCDSCDFVRWNVHNNCGLWDINEKHYRICAEEMTIQIGSHWRWVTRENTKIVPIKDDTIEVCDTVWIYGDPHGLGVFYKGTEILFVDTLYYLTDCRDSIAVDGGQWNEN
jgi:hypothetical protein